MRLKCHLDTIITIFLWVRIPSYSRIQLTHRALCLDRMCNEIRSEIQYTIQRLPEGIEPYDLD